MRGKRKKKKAQRKLYLIGGSVIAVSLVSFLGYSVALNNSVRKWDNKIYSGVAINNIDLTGKTIEEAKDVLNDEFVSKIGDKKINIKVGDKKLQYRYSDIDAGYNIEKAVEEAISFGKDKSLYNKNSLIKNKKEKKYNRDLEFTFNKDKIVSLEKDIKSKVNVKPTNAKILINQGNISLTPEVMGYKLNDDILNSKIIEKLDGGLDKDTNISFDLENDNPKITHADLSKIKPQALSTFTTSYSTSDMNRSFNVEYVTKLIDGLVLMPGEEFSYSDISQKGKGQYKMATAYINDKPVPSEGGGICQVSTTLYRAMMRANVKSTERHNHSLPVGYAPLGLDATVAWGYLDYKFKNPYDFPIYIEGINNNKTVTFNIYGDPIALNNKTYDIVSEVIGEKQANSYHITYENGKEVNREFIAKDTYK